MHMSDEPSACEQHRPVVLGYFTRRLRSRDEAEDLCQETFARVLGRTEHLRDPEKLRAYLFKAARNLLLNHLKRRHVVTSVSDLGEDVDVELVADRTSDPEAATRGKELEDKLHGLLEELPAEQRTAFELGVLERLLYSEIAAITGWSPAKVKINVYRARKKLIDGLREYRAEKSSEGS